MGSQFDNSKKGYINFISDEAREHLLRVWAVNTDVTRGCYSLFFKNKKQNFLLCIKNNEENTTRKNVIFAEDIDSLINQAITIIENFYNENGIDDVYIGINPVNLPEQGRGTVNDVISTKFFIADMDFKEVEIKKEEVEFQGCKELEDHALKCYFEHNRKYYKLERPSLNQVLQLLKENNIPVPTFVIDSGRGYHFYWLLDKEYENLDEKELKKKKDSANIKVLYKLFAQELHLKVSPLFDKNVADISRMLRLAGTINTKINRIAKIIDIPGGEEYKINDFRKLINELRNKQLIKADDKKTEYELNNDEKNNEEKREEENETNEEIRNDNITSDNNIKNANIENNDFLPEELGELEEISKTTETSDNEDYRLLTKKELLELFGLISEIYVEGHRQFILLWLSGWMAKAKINILSAVELTTLLYNEIEITHKRKDSLEERLSAIVYTYARSGVDVSKYADKIKEISGVDLKNIPQMREEAVKGKSGLEEEAFEVYKEKIKNESVEELTEEQIEKIAEQKTDELIDKITKILRSHIQDKRLIKYLIDERRKIYAVADRLVYQCGYKIEDKDGRFYFTNVVFHGAPLEIEERTNFIKEELNIPPRYRITWAMMYKEKNNTKQLEKISLPVATIDEILIFLDNKGLIQNHAKAKDMISNIITAFRFYGLLEKNNKDFAPGVYIDEKLEKIFAVGIDTSMPSSKEIDRSLDLAEILADKYFHHIETQFVTAFLLNLLLPFSFLIKYHARKMNKQRWIPGLYIYGVKGAGKTTIGLILRSVWGKTESTYIIGSRTDTVAKLGRVLDDTTFPVQIDEGGFSLYDDRYKDMIKGATIDIFSRDISSGRDSKYPYLALANIIFTTNHPPPGDDALLRRFVVIALDRTIPGEQQKKFHKEIETRLHELQPLGRFIINEVVKHPELIINDRHIEIEWRDIALELLRRAYEYAKRKMPDFWKLEYEYKEWEDIDTLQMIKATIQNVVTDIYAKNSHEKDKAFYDILQDALKFGWIPGLYETNEYIIIERSFFENYIKNKVQNITHMSSLANVLNCEYKTISRNGNKERVIICKKSRFMSLYEDIYDEEDEQRDLDDYSSS